VSGLPTHGPSHNAVEPATATPEEIEENQLVHRFEAATALKRSDQEAYLARVPPQGTANKKQGKNCQVEGCTRYARRDDRCDKH
jgi:hypothetical protein